MSIQNRKFSVAEPNSVMSKHVALDEILSGSHTDQLRAHDDGGTWFCVRVTYIPCPTEICKLMPLEIASATAAGAP